MLDDFDGMRNATVLEMVLAIIYLILMFVLTISFFFIIVYFVVNIISYLLFGISAR